MLQVEPQFTPPTSDVTLPEPFLLTDKVYFTWEKVAATEVAVDMVMTHVPVPLHGLPAQPVNT